MRIKKLSTGNISLPVLFFLLVPLFTFQIQLFSQGFAEETAISLPGLVWCTVAWGDYDNDDDLDLLISGGSGSFPDPQAFTGIYSNNGSNSFTEQTGDSILDLMSSSAVWGDLDNDGFLDLVISGRNRIGGHFTKIYRNNGGFRFTEQKNSMLTGASDGSVALGDYNNDGKQDILLTGATGGYTPDPVSKIYKNEGDFIFSEQSSVSLTAIYSSSVAWGDYDNDGDLDILLSGSDQVKYGSHNEFYSSPLDKIYKNEGNNIFTMQTSISMISGLSAAAWGDFDNDGDLDLLLSGNLTTRIYKNNGNNSFSELSGISINGVLLGSQPWGDYDNDGFIDFIISGTNNETGKSACIIYRNNGDNTFSKQTDLSLPGISSSSLAWGDYDKDGDLDIVISGNGENGFITKIYRNELNKPNQNPTPPVNLESSFYWNTLKFSWDAASDAETPASGLSYNLRIGTAPGKSDILAPPANTFTGSGKLAKRGDIQTTSWAINNLTTGTYYWAVQAVDNGFAHSVFSEEKEISVISGLPGNNIFRPSVFPNPSDGYFSIKFQGLSTVRIEIYSPEGKLIYSLKSESEDKINISLSRKGVYFIKIISPSAVYYDKILITE